MPSIEQMSDKQVAKALRKKGLEPKYAELMSRHRDDPKWIPSLQKIIDGKAVFPSV